MPLILYMLDNVAIGLKTWFCLYGVAKCDASGCCVTGEAVINCVICSLSNPEKGCVLTASLSNVLSDSFFSRFICQHNAWRHNICLCILFMLFLKVNSNSYITKELINHPHSEGCTLFTQFFSSQLILGMKDSIMISVIVCHKIMPLF